MIKVYKPENEKKLNIDDDYIKFTRFAHWKIHQHWEQDDVKGGVIGIITNNSFLRIRSLLSSSLFSVVL